MGRDIIYTLQSVFQNNRSKAMSLLLHRSAYLVFSNFDILTRETVTHTYTHTHPSKIMFVLVNVGEFGILGCKSFIFFDKSG